MKINQEIPTSQVPEAPKTGIIIPEDRLVAKREAKRRERDHAGLGTRANSQILRPAIEAVLSEEDRARSTKSLQEVQERIAELSEDDNTQEELIELKKEEVSLQEKLGQINAKEATSENTPEKIASNPETKARKNASEARLAIIETRLKEITPNGIIINAEDSDEYAELIKELNSLKSRAGESATKNETSNESTPSIKEIDDKELPSTYQAAIKRIDENKKETALESKLSKEDQEKVDAILSATNENLEKTGGTPESRAISLGREAMIGIGMIGERYSKIPAKYKYATSALLILAGGAAAMTGATVMASAVYGAGIGLRLLGGAAMFAGFQKFLNKAYEDTHDGEVSELARSTNAVASLALASAVALLLPDILREQIHGAEIAIDDYFSPSDAISLEGTTNEALLGNEVVGNYEPNPLVDGENLKELSTIKAGQGFWHPIQNQLAEANPDWTKAELNAATQKTLLENNILKADGTELRLHPGDQVVLNSDGSITYDKEGAYTFKQPAVEAPTTTEVSPIAPEISTEATPAVPVDQAVIVQNADTQVRTYVNELLGRKGIFGFGATGPDTIEKINDWSNPHVGFAHQTIGDVMNHQVSPMGIGMEAKYGVNNPLSLEKMQHAITKVAAETGINPGIDENVDKYLHRAVTTKLMKDSYTY